MVSLFVVVVLTFVAVTLPSLAFAFGRITTTRIGTFQDVGTKAQRQPQHRRRRRRLCFWRSPSSTFSCASVAASTVSMSTSATSSSSSSDAAATRRIAAAPADRVIVLPDANDVGATIRAIVVDAAKTAIAERGHFYLAIPGGSILKMLVGSGGDTEDALSWTSKTTVAYVNHKCVPMDDSDLATHAKARKLFLDGWTGVDVLVMDGTDDGEAEAIAYEDKIRKLTTTENGGGESGTLLQVGDDGVPVFDLALIGVGDDGHVGSLYPDRDEVLMGPDGPWVLSVPMKQPPSITLSLPVMAAARNVVVAACGVSDKYPQGKSAGMYRAIADPGETLRTFPAAGLRTVATWYLDRAAASKLGDTYNNGP